MTGFEGGGASVDGVTLTGTASNSATQARTGTRSLRVNPGASSNGGATFGSGSYVHFGLYVTSLPDASFRVFGSTGAGIDVQIAAPFPQDGTFRLQVRNNASNLGTQMVGFAFGLWHWIAVRTVAGTSVPFIAVDGVSGAAATASPTGTVYQVGADSVGPAGTDIYIDDIIIDDTGFLSPSKVAMLVPTADSAIGTGWTLGSGGTTSLFGGVDNIPPTAVADAGTTAQIRNATSNANVNYDATMTTYAAAGIAAGDTILAVQPVISTAAPVTTSAKLGTVGVASNPTIANIALGAGGTAGAFWSGVAGGTWPTGWKGSFGTLTTSPSVTLGTAPVMRVTQVTASTRIAMVALMGINVAWTPAAAAAAQLPHVSPYPQILAH